MAPSLFSKAFIIVKLDENGEPVEIMPYDKNEATYVAVSISICRGMLKKQIVKNCFKSLAKDLDPTSFLTRADATLSAEVFIEKILEEFPLVFVDYSRKNPNEAGYHLRRPWGDTESAWFESHDHAIGINGPRVDDMCSAGWPVGEAAWPGSAISKRFRTFLFELAITMLHELAHIFITFLTHGEANTPPRISGQVAGSSERTTSGEAGDYLEDAVFGGRVTLKRNPTEGEGQAGIPYLVTRDGAFEIKQKTIDDIVGYKFDLPIRDLDLGAPCPESLKSLGAGLPVDPIWVDPQAMPQLEHLVETHKADKSKWDKWDKWDEADKLMEINPTRKVFGEDQEKKMKEIPFSPKLRIGA